jgi:hypothetical protein
MSRRVKHFTAARPPESAKEDKKLLKRTDRNLEPKREPELDQESEVVSGQRSAMDSLSECVSKPT